MPSILSCLRHPSTWTSQQRKWITCTLFGVVASGYLLYKRQHSVNGVSQKKNDESAHTKNKRLHVNKQFWQQLRALLRIMIPRLLCRESGLLFGHSIVLMTRTLISIYVSSMEGQLVQAAVRKRVGEF